MRALYRTLALALPFVLPCGVPGCAGASATSARRASRLSLAEALADVLERRPVAVPFEVELEEHEGRAAVEVELFDGTSPVEMFFAADTGAYLAEGPEAPDSEGEAALLPTLRERIASSGTSLRAALRMAESRYVMADVVAIELVLRAERLLVRVQTSSGSSAVDHFHDPETGATVTLPPPEPDAGAADAGAVDTGAVDAGTATGATR